MTPALRAPAQGADAPRTHREPCPGKRSIQARDALDGYMRGEHEIVGNTGYPHLPHLTNLARQALPPRLALALRRLATDAVRPLLQPLVGKMQKRSPLRLHLGSGRFPKEDYVNLDLFGAPVDLPWNLRRRIPLDDCSVESIFHEHLLEHLSLEEGFRLTLECQRLLRSGGFLRIGVPDAGAYLRSYAGESTFLERIRPGRPTPLLALQEVFYRDGHKTVYDFETLSFLLAAAGFGEVERCAFGVSRLDPCPDGEHRRSETLYVEAIKA